MIQLDQIKIASPCSADWEAMTGTDQARFCGSCRKNVYNLSEMTRDEAQRVVEEHEGRLCVRFYTRADGTMLTQDCPVGLRAVRYRRVKKFSYAAAVLLSCGVGLMRGASAVTKVQKHPVSTAKTHTKPIHKVTRPRIAPDPFVVPGGDLRTMGAVSYVVPAAKAHPKSRRLQPVKPAATLGRMVKPQKQSLMMGDVAGPTAGMPTMGKPLMGAPRPPK